MEVKAVLEFEGNLEERLNKILEKNNHTVLNFKSGIAVTFRYEALIWWLFPWEDTPQGWGYWKRIAEKIEDKFERRR